MVVDAAIRGGCCYTITGRRWICAGVTHFTRTRLSASPTLAARRPSPTRLRSAEAAATPAAASRSSPVSILARSRKPFATRWSICTKTPPEWSSTSLKDGNSHLHISHLHISHDHGGCLSQWSIDGSAPHPTNQRENGSRWISATSSSRPLLWQRMKPAETFLSLLLLLPLPPPDVIFVRVVAFPLQKSNMIKMLTHRSICSPRGICYSSPSILPLAFVFSFLSFFYRRLRVRH